MTIFLTVLHVMVCAILIVVVLLQRGKGAEIGAVFLRTDTELILKSRRVVPGRLPAAGFAFRFTDWETAAGDLVTRWRARG